MKHLHLLGWITDYYHASAKVWNDDNSWFNDRELSDIPNGATQLGEYTAAQGWQYTF